jgi:hypothetical protein
MFASTPEEDELGVGLVRKELNTRRFVVWPYSQTNVIAGWYEEKDLYIVSESNE